MFGQIGRLLEYLAPTHLYRRGQLPSIRYLCRKALLLRLIRDQPCGRFLEIGFGLGDWLLTLSDLGFEGVGVEISKRAAELLENVPGAESRAVRLVIGDAFEMDFREEFDFVFALEVLEHIQDDEMAFRKIASLLRRGGKLILSVPAHMKYWAPSDEARGHFRRYERQELVRKLSRSGFRVQKLWCYGFPLSNLLSPIRDSIALKLSGLNMSERTLVSGVYRPLEERYHSILSLLARLIVPFQLKLQNLFLEREVGDGYLVIASRL